MNTNAKVLIPNKAWILEEHGSKLGTLNKQEKGYAFFNKGKKIELKDISAVKSKFGEELFKESLNNIKSNLKNNDINSIYDFPCSCRPFNSVYNIKKKLPIYSKNSKSKSLYCAGYYTVSYTHLTLPTNREV